jgi:methyl-accepting chemotaxis protein
MNRVSVKFRLFILVGLLSLVSIVVGLTGLRGMSETVGGLRTVYEDRVVPLRDLKVIADLYAVNIVDTSHKVRNGNIDWAEARKNLKDARQGIDKTWKAYKATFLVEEEKKRVAVIEPMLAEAESTLNDLQAILVEEDKRAISRFTAEVLYPVIDPSSTQFSELIEVQQNVAKAEYTNSSAQYEQPSLFSIVLLSAGSLAGFVERQLGGKTAQPGAKDRPARVAKL